MRQKFHALKKPAIRSSWNKYNLFNLSRATPLSTRSLTLFQQKWKSSTLSRHYHGEPIQEKKWQRLFRGSVRSVVPMDPVYLANFDGAEQGAGRGSGLQKSSDAARGIPPIPYLSMVYAPLERRLDTAVFRALFASSLRQARQMVIHGSVSVNGKKMRYPGYQLNPGDMYMVDPERVMFATGKLKDRTERRAGRVERARAGKEQSASANPTAEDAENAEESSKPDGGNPTSQDAIAATADERKVKVKSLQDLVAQAREILSAPTVSLSAKRKQELRSFQRKVRSTISRPNSNLEADLKDQLAEINSRIAPQTKASPSGNPIAAADLPQLSSPALREELRDLTPIQLQTFKDALIDAQENPIDLTKPYATPWQPRDYMSAFAFIPRYLEVHPKICAAVYIRHPVARPGLAEVPSPFNNEMLTLTHSWYLRRR